MKKFLLGLVLALASAAFAAGPVDFIARQGNDYVIVHTASACSNEKVLAGIPDEYKPKFVTANAHVSDHDFAACAMPYGGYVYVLYEDGDKGVIPMDQFKPLTEA